MKIPNNTPYFTFHTTSPKIQRSCDCVVRAISTALGWSWESVYKDLCHMGAVMYRMPNEREVYEKHLKDTGWVKMRAPKNGRKGVRGYEFIEKYAKNITGPIIVHTRRHLTVIVNGTFHDLWNPSNEVVGNYWVRTENKSIV